MPVEIEYKYLVDAEQWKTIQPAQGKAIIQGYIFKEPGKNVRVRTKGDKGYITIKGKSNGPSRPEYEYEIPLEEAKELLRDFCTQHIEKIRYEVEHEGHTWEVDVFSGANAGLIMAEIELRSESEAYALPHWVGANVSTDYRYGNAYLVDHPYGTWPKA